MRRFLENGESRMTLIHKIRVTFHTRPDFAVTPASFSDAFYENLITVALLINWTAATCLISPHHHITLFTCVGLVTLSDLKP